MAEYRTITVEAMLSNSTLRATPALSEMIIPASVTISTDVAYSPLPHYSGAYEVTPSSETQVLATAGEAMDGDIIINPVPSNYGLITWDGAVLTVS